MRGFLTKEPFLWINILLLVLFTYSEPPTLWRLFKPKKHSNPTPETMESSSNTIMQDTIMGITAVLPTKDGSTLFEHVDRLSPSFNYRAVMGKLNYLESRILLTQYTNAIASWHVPRRHMPRQSSALAATALATTYWQQDTKVTISAQSHTARSFECFVDASFAGEWVNHLNNKPYLIQTLPGVTQDLSLCWQEDHCFGPASSKQRLHSVQRKLR